MENNIDWLHIGGDVITPNGLAVASLITEGDEVYTSLGCFLRTDLKPVPSDWEEGETRNSAIASDVIQHDNNNKYSRKIKTIVVGGIDHDVFVDVYDVLEAFSVNNSAMAHAVKKMLAGGQRGHKGIIQDMDEAIQSIERAKQLENNS